ncbi:MAG: hypothetical protein LBF91_08620 [Azoarcus sp.]|jgi:hypothetical protein|nr:hypothetical protein [Azoarcus sp.]
MAGKRAREEYSMISGEMRAVFEGYYEKCFRKTVKKSRFHFQNEPRSFPLIFSSAAIGGDGKCLRKILPLVRVSRSELMGVFHPYPRKAGRRAGLGSSSRWSMAFRAAGMNDAIRSATPGGCDEKPART